MARRFLLSTCFVEVLVYSADTVVDLRMAFARFDRPYSADTAVAPRMAFARFDRPYSADTVVDPRMAFARSSVRLEYIEVAVVLEAEFEAESVVVLEAEFGAVFEVEFVVEQVDLWVVSVVEVSVENTEYLLTTASDVGEIFVLSKAPRAEKFIGGQKYVEFVAKEKRKWIASNLSRFFDAKHVIICNGQKGKVMQPNNQDVLVDDRQENITEWESHGGVGVLFTNALDTANRLVLLKNHTNVK